MCVFLKAVYALFLTAKQSQVFAKYVFGAAIVGDKRPVHWEAKNEAADFFDLKGDIERVLSLTAVRHDLQFVAKQFAALHPGQSAAIMLDGEEIGFIGTAHPSIVQKLGIKGKPIVCEILASAIAERPVAQAGEISRFPANNRDIAVVVDESVPAGEILNACRKAAGSQLVGLNLFDVYRGANLAEGKKSLAISLTVQDKENIRRK